MIHFDESTHTYTTGSGHVLDSVTQILQAEGIIDTSWYNDAAAERGTIIHEQTALIDSGVMTLSDFADTEFFTYLQAWERFKKDTHFIPHDIEKLVYSEALGYAGTLDRTGTIYGSQEVLLDIKTGAHERWHGLQLAGYAVAGKIEEKKRVVVHLKADGKYSLIDRDKKVGSYDEPSWKAYWLSLITTHRFKGML